MVLLKVGTVRDDFVVLFVVGHQPGFYFDAVGLALVGLFESGLHEDFAAAHRRFLTAFRLDDGVQFLVEPVSFFGALGHDQILFLVVEGIDEGFEFLVVIGPQVGIFFRIEIGDGHVGDDGIALLDALGGELDGLHLIILIWFVDALFPRQVLLERFAIYVEVFEHDCLLVVVEMLLVEDFGKVGIPEIGEDFGAGGADMDVDVRFIFELLRHPRAGGRLDELDRALDRALHPLFAWGEVEGRAIGEHQPAAFERHRFGHDEH